MKKLDLTMEDVVRDDVAKVTLGFNDGEADVLQGAGQTTTFNMLGFPHVKGAPDGWYFPKDTYKVAIILETKAITVNIYSEKCTEEILRNLRKASAKYSKIVGILFNGEDVRVFKNEIELTDVAKTLQHKSYYINLFAEEKIDKNKIYNLTKKINDCLHTKFGIQNLHQRMIFTACALVAKRDGALLVEGMNFETLKVAVVSTLESKLTEEIKKNEKLRLLTDQYQKVEYNSTSNQEAINEFISCVTEISECINSSNWHGEDVMGIFFNEFNRYRAKADRGQVFTPDHITSFMYRLIDVNKDDKVLDAACGSGAFLVKAMCNMVKEVGGMNTTEADKITNSQLFGIEFDNDIFALACANMLIHKDGKTNIVQMDSRTQEAIEWIKEKKISKVLMNPPFETKFGCLKIVGNVLESVPKGTACAFILPDKKLEKDHKSKNFGNSLLKNNRLKTIVKLPENLFFGAGVTTSIFIFEAGIPQDGKDIIGYYIEEDGLETVKNQGRQDIRNKWPEKEDYWIKAIHNGIDEVYHTRQVINPKEHLSYQMPEVPFEIFEEDFIKTLVDYEMYKAGIDKKTFSDQLLFNVYNNSRFLEEDGKIILKCDNLDGKN